MIDIYDRINFINNPDLDEFNQIEYIYLKPTIGYSLHIEHLASCLAVSAAANRWSTGSQTMDWGSSFNHSKKWFKFISDVTLALKHTFKTWIKIKHEIKSKNHYEWKLTYSKQLRTEGSILEPPNAATSPSCLGIIIMSYNNKPSFRWLHVSLLSAIKLNISNKQLKKKLKFIDFDVFVKI